ncbi:MAG: hypothetical protein GIX03_12410 [Candidatus Eremiobacteraeota bacterium]|nr:hypothetical protein [Candidatus Eremiobacteraeota bacterium]MBC5803767.1 hypothetical protein [Candidatus Eremiobacteraeota bacterium]MBC5821839.1 hypothetical protein [Candidatus Eremiobacteraeota bacterium]
MVKGLIWGSVGFAVAFGASRLVGTLTTDLKRYDMIRAQSGDGPFVFELLGKLPDLMSALPPLMDAASRESGKLLMSIPSDALRYARISSM